MTVHMQKEIGNLKNLILSMSAKVEKNFEDSIFLYEKMNKVAAEKLMKDDEKIDMMEIEIEEECLKVLALYQPVAIDLRFIVAVLKINNHLERINDLVVNIAERALDLSGYPNLEIPFDLWGMSQRVQSMLNKSLLALINMDTDQAMDVLTLDDEVDDMHKTTYAEVKKRIVKAPEEIDKLIQMPSLSRYLERIADLASNIAEEVIYMVDGEIVRHQKL